jgi:quercetin dioxygenase-like cupin family protein
MKSYTLSAMRYMFLFQFLLGATAFAQQGAVHVTRDRVDAALAKGGVLLTRPQVQVAGVHRGTPGVLETQRATSILYVTEGEGTLAAEGMRSQRLTKGDVLVVPANTAQAFTAVSSPISYLRITVPVMVKDATAEIVYVDHDKVAATMKKAAPLADGPNFRVSGGFRPFASTAKSPVAEIHTNEADFFYIVEGRATQVIGGTVIDGKETGPGQVRGPRTEGGRTYHVTKGDIMWVPANMPHWFPEIPEALGYLLVKVFY